MIPPKELFLTNLTKPKFKLFRSLSEVFMEYPLLTALVFVFLANGLKLTKENVVCMPVTNETCTISQNNSSQSEVCKNVTEIDSVSFSEYVALDCSKNIHEFIKSFELTGMLCIFILYFFSELIHNYPYHYCRLIELQNVIEKCNTMKNKLLRIEIKRYETLSETEKYHSEQEISVADVLELKELMKYANEVCNSFQTNVSLHCRNCAADTNKTHLDSQSPTTESDKKSNVKISERIPLVDHDVERQPYIPIPPKKMNRCGILTMYIVCSVSKLLIAASYTVVLSFGVETVFDDPSFQCTFEDQTKYENDYFLCRHSLPDLYLYLSPAILASMILYISSLIAQMFLTRRRYKRDKWPELKLPKELKLVLILADAYEDIYFDAFFDMLGESFRRNLTFFITDSENPIAKLREQLEKCHYRLEFQNVSKVPNSLFIDPVFSMITSLRITNSDLSEFNQWKSLESLHALKELIFSNCNIKEIEILVQNNTECLENLKTLDVSYNCIEKFHMDKLPCNLSTLNVVGNSNIILYNSCPASLNLLYVDDKNIHEGDRSTYSNVSIHDKPDEARKVKPRNWSEISKCMYRVTNSKHRGHVIIINNQIEKIPDSSKFNNKNNQMAIESEVGASGHVKEVAFLRGIFCDLDYKVCVYCQHFEEAIEQIQGKCDNTVIIIIMGDIAIEEQMNVLSKFVNNRRLNGKPKLAISVGNNECKGKILNEIDIFYAHVTEKFPKQLVASLKEDDETDIFTMMKEWENAKIHRNRLTKNFYFLAGYPWSDSSLEQSATGEDYHKRLKLRDRNGHFMKVMTALRYNDLVETVEATLGIEEEEFRFVLHDGYSIDDDYAFQAIPDGAVLYILKNGEVLKEKISNGIRETSNGHQDDTANADTKVENQKESLTTDNNTSLDDKVLTTLKRDQLKDDANVDAGPATRSSKDAHLTAKADIHEPPPDQK